DVLIIFADRDNEVAGNKSLGWVTQFKKFLETLLTQVLGQKPNILLKSEFDSLTSPRLDNVATSVFILSKDFIQSSRCLEHIESFLKVIGTSANHQNRVFKVFKTPLSVQEQPHVISELLGYEMYQLDPDSGDIREYADYFGADAERQYWMEMVDLSYDILDALSVLNDGASRSDVKSIFNRKTIYLAETGHDLSVQRNILNRELQRLGYSVLPRQALPGKLNELETVVRRDLAGSSMSIHLIGSTYGDIPEGSDRSIQELQNKLAADKSIQAKEQREDFSRLIWISPDMSHMNDRQKRFVETLKRDAEGQENTEILQTLLEDFKNIIREELQDASEKKILEETGGRAIYVMHDKADHENVKPYVDLIRTSGFHVLMPSFEGELLELRQKHIENLRNLDGAIIFKGKANDQWVRMKALDLLKAPGFGRKKPIMGKAIVTPAGASVDKATFKSQNLRVIEG
ncbi:MAG: hypothetical protein C0490_24320, partial [Marivirga sp.]|nr:hypothetical protein [Marivirga sp.]